MDSMSYNFNMEDQKAIFSTANDTKATATTESFVPTEFRRLNAQENSFSPPAAPFQGRADNELLTLLSQQEPRVADTAPSAADVDAMTFRMGGSDLLFDDVDQNQNFYMGNSRAESMSSHSNLWSEGTGGVPAARNGEMIDTFDFLVKTLSSANNYVSMLTREQLFVLRSIRPGLLYEFLLEVAKVRGDKRMRRALPNECAFCKNNGENEECYTEHALKDWRGRVLCPVLRAFRCPRCGATGDRAHTIKYCPENGNAVSDRDQRSGLPSRRRGPPSLDLNSMPLGLRMQSGPPTGPTPTPTSSPSPSPATAAYTHSSLWSSFGMN